MTTLQDKLKYNSILLLSTDSTFCVEFDDNIDISAICQQIYYIHDLIDDDDFIDKSIEKLLSERILILHTHLYQKIDELFNDFIEKARIFRINNSNGDGKKYWYELKNNILDVDLSCLFEWKNVFNEEIQMMIDQNVDDIRVHFLAQQINIPKFDNMCLTKICQIAFNIGQYHGSQKLNNIDCFSKLSDFISN